MLLCRRNRIKFSSVLTVFIQFLNKPNKHSQFSFPAKFILGSTMVPHDLDTFWNENNLNASRSKNYCYILADFPSCCWKTKSLCSEKGKWQMKIRYCFTLVRSLRRSKGWPLSSCCPQRLFTKMAGAGDFKDFGPLVGAIDQGTSSSRFLVSRNFF